MKPITCNPCPHKKICPLDVLPTAKLGLGKNYNYTRCIYFKEYEYEKVQHKTK